LRFWVETACAVAALALAVLTAVWRDWIELILRVNADRHSGTLEWTIVGTLVVIALASALSARRHLRRQAALLRVTS
jgi:hypothetical protein